MDTKEAVSGLATSPRALEELVPFSICRSARSFCGPKANLCRFGDAELLLSSNHGARNEPFELVRH